MVIIPLSSNTLLQVEENKDIIDKGRGVAVLGFKLSI